MQKIDVIMLANNVEERHYQLSLETIESLRKTNSDVEFNIIIMESNRDSDYIFDGCTIIKPEIKFNYAEFVNIGYSRCINDWVLVINNDLYFTPEWFNEVAEVYNKDNSIESFSFYEPDYHGKYFSGLFNDSDDVYEGYDVGSTISGWCILHRRSVIDKIIKWDAAFSFYYVDDDYGQSIKSKGIRNAMLKKSIVYHRVSQSHETIPDLVNQRAADLARNLYEKKWFSASPLLSVIVPAFAFDEYIAECIDSILSQNTDFEIEILVRDDHSCDRTNDILYSKYHDNKKVHILSSTENIGPFGNIKFLIERSRGKYIAYIDGDDYFTDQDKLQKQVDFLEAHPDYFMHSTGYRNLFPDGTIRPLDGKWNTPLKSDLTHLDLLESNMVTFGRVFRNSPGLMREWMADSPYLDWAFNFQASLMGKIKCEAWCSGIYRHNENGMFSLKTQEQKDADNSYIRSLLAERLVMKNSKITIIDCFAHSETIKIKLKDAIRKIKSTGCDVMLISNTSMERDIIDMCDFYLYDKRNQLFKKEYTNVTDVQFFNSNGPFVAYNIKPGLQRHGLSVLVNLFNALNTAKSLGYTYFQRIECDDLFGNISLSAMSNVDDICSNEGKKGLFYFNESPGENNISFHYFYCEIDYFLKSVNPIRNENDYIEYLMRENGNMDFVIAESYVYDNLIKAGRENVIHKSGSHDMNLDFPDTTWNTETSGSNMEEKYNGCLTEIYKTYNSDGTPGTNVVYSYNYSGERKKRIIDIYSDSSNYYIEQLCECRGAWAYTPIPDDVIYIDVCEDDIKLYSQKNENIKSYLKFT